MTRPINSQILFLTTSPRTPEKMIPEIELLAGHFSGLPWNHHNQCEFMDKLREADYFNGKGEKDPAFSARDRINRGPKSLGFIVLSPVISLTPAGKALIESKHKEEIFLRQLLKFQVPSPYHRPTEKAAYFHIKPYLELLRLIRTLGTLKFDELQLFGMQLTDWHEFDNILAKIKNFRKEKIKNEGRYRQFKNECLKNELKTIYAKRIAEGKIKTRESNDRSLEKFLNTQSNNMRDYADACFRYLRASGVVNVSSIGKSLSIISEKTADVDYILSHIDRNPCFINDERAYLSYLGNPDIPELLTDNRSTIIQRLQKNFPTVTISNADDTDSLKDLLSNLTERRRIETINRQIKDIKDYKQYDDIQDKFNRIIRKELYDAPLMLEWNMWRAMTMMDGGRIKANLKFDDFGQPLSTAQGNMADIICDYGNYLLTVEVTMTNGQKQFETESESVSRHLGKIKKEYNKPCYCLFIAPAINEACIAYFYMLHRTNISYYGGTSIIVPLPLNIFQKMLEDSFNAHYVPNSTQVRRLFEYSNELAKKCLDEKVWFEGIKNAAMNWLE